MRINVRANNLRLTTDQRQLIERRIRFTLGRFADRIEDVTVRMRDLNGPRGGVDVHCQAEVRLVPRGRLIIQAVDELPEPAVSRVAERLGRRIRMNLQMRQTMRRRRGLESPPTAA